LSLGINSPDLLLPPQLNKLLVKKKKGALGYLQQNALLRGRGFDFDSFGKGGCIR
jgi:hypothetical protein